MKAKFLRKEYGTGWYQRDMVFLYYEYRGCEYEVYENRAKGNIPLSWQHKNEQLIIDAILDAPVVEHTKHPFDADEVWKIYGWD